MAVSRRSPQETLQKALALFQSGEPAKAERLVRPLVASNPANAGLLQLLGILCNRQGKHVDAIRFSAKAVELAPQSGQAHYNLGTAYFDSGKLELAVASLETAAALLPDDYDAINNLGLTLLRSARLDEAEARLRQAIALRPAGALAHHNLGLLLELTDRPADALESFRLALEAKHARPVEVHTAMARALTALERHKEAVEALAAASKLDPHAAEPYFRLGMIHQLQGRPEEAARCYDRAQQLDPDEPSYAVWLACIRRHVCDWQAFDGLARKAVRAALAAPGQADPVALMAISDDPQALLVNATRYAANIAQKVRPLPQRVPRGRDRIRLAYLSPELHLHATAILTAGLFEVHDRGRFEVLGISWGPNDGSALRARLERGFDRFIDVAGQGPAAIAERIAAEDVDIAVDLKGLAPGGLPGVLARRPAPVQVGFLGLPGTSGAPWIDYLLADRIVVPAGHHAHFTERIVTLPDSYQVNDARRELPGPAPARKELGLPEDGLVLCCLSGGDKITPAVFEIWMRLLKAVPGSALWLFPQHDAAQINLRREAAARGVDPGRLVFAAPVDHARHTARLQQADLFLDTLPLNAHALASDALWAGVPLLTMEGRTFAGRVASSLLRAAGLPELVTDGLDGYERLALALAQDRTRLSALRQRLIEGRATARLFDTARFCRHVETAYEEMHRIRLAGEAPRAIDLAA